MTVFAVGYELTSSHILDFVLCNDVWRKSWSILREASHTSRIRHFLWSRDVVKESLVYHHLNSAERRKRSIARKETWTLAWNNSVRLCFSIFHLLYSHKRAYFRGRFSWLILCWIYIWVIVEIGNSPWLQSVGYSHQLRGIRTLGTGLKKVGFHLGSAVCIMITESCVINICVTSSHCLAHKNKVLIFGGRIFCVVEVHYNPSSSEFARFDSYMSGRSSSESNLLNCLSRGEIIRVVRDWLIVDYFEVGKVVFEVRKSCPLLFFKRHQLESHA